MSYYSYIFFSVFSLMLIYAWNLLFILRQLIFYKSFVTGLFQLFLKFHAQSIKQFTVINMFTHSFKEHCRHVRHDYMLQENTLFPHCIIFTHMSPNSLLHHSLHQLVRYSSEAYCCFLDLAIVLVFLMDVIFAN